MTHTSVSIDASGTVSVYFGEKLVSLASDPALFFPPVQQTPEVWAELDHTLGGGGFVG